MAWPHPITLLGVAGGAVAALVVAPAANALDDGPLPAVEFWARTVAGTHPNDAVREGLALHALYGALLGGLYPWLVHGLAGLPGRYVATLPAGVATGLVFGLVAFGLAAALDAAGVVGVADASPGWAGALAVHLLYGLSVGVWTGLATHLWYPLFGV